MCAGILRAEREYERQVKIYGSTDKYDEMQKMSLSELTKLNKMVSDMIQEKREKESKDVKFSLKVGDIVSVNDKKSKEDIFEVVKLNRKNAVIKDELGVKYNCPYSLISII